MGLIEEGLRSTFATRVAAPPALEDLADTAIRRGRGIRRRRTVVGAVAAILAVVAVGVGVVPTLHRGGPTTPAAGPNGAGTVTLPVDVLANDRILRASGGSVALTDLGGTPERAYEVSGGWIVTVTDTSGQESAVWFIDASGTRRALATGVKVMVSPGSADRPGPQIAWTDDLVHLGTFADGAVSAVATTKAPLAPVRVVGGALILAGGQTWDDWFPARGAYKAAASTLVLLGVVGASADNSQVLALYAEGASQCLGQLDPNGFVPKRTTCRLSVGPDDTLYPSPDGRFLALRTAGSVAIYDTDNAWSSNPVPLTTLAYASATVVWQGHEAVIASGTKVVAANADTGQSRVYDLPTDVRNAIAPIPDLR